MKGKAQKLKQLIIFFSCIARYLNSLFVTDVGHLPFCFHKILINVGGGWSLREITDALFNNYSTSARWISIILSKGHFETDTLKLVGGIN